MFKRIIDPSYHFSGMARTGFGTDEAPSILQRLHTLYRKFSLGEIDESLLCLHDPTERNQPVEVMIWVIEEVQIFLLSHPEHNMSRPDTELINYEMNKINKTGIYSRALAHRNSKTATNSTIWANFRTHMIAEYKKLIAKGGGKTLIKEVYGTPFHTTEETEKNVSSVETIVEYAYQATVGERKMSDLENLLSMMDINGMPPPETHKYYAPKMAY